MSFEPLVNPLQRFPVFQTSDPEEFRHALLTRYGAISAEIKPSKSLTSRGSLIQLQNIGLIYGQGSATASADFPARATSFPWTTRKFVVTFSCKQIFTLLHPSPHNPHPTFFHRPNILPLFLVYGLELSILE